MTRSKRLTLTDEIVRAAREWVVCRRELVDRERKLKASAALEDAVDALDAYGPAEVVGGRGAFVHDSPETSEISAHLMSPLTGSIRQRVIDEIACGMWEARGTKKGLTCREVELRMKRPHTTVSSAVNWGINAGWLADSGFRRDATPNHPAIVWCLTPAAMSKRGER